MTDLHTHILPAMDDGAEDVKTSIDMLCAEFCDGVDVVALTPHFYRHREDTEKFFRRREKSYAMLKAGINALKQGEKEKLPELVLGAEVAWWPGISDMDELELLCIGDTQNLLLELPFAPWDAGIINNIYNIMGKFGITPVIAHIERYLHMQSKSVLRDIFSLDVPIQLGCESLLHPALRRTALKLIKRDNAHFVASDCHNMSDRRPNMKAALDVVYKKFGDDITDSLLYCAESLAKE